MFHNDYKLIRGNYENNSFEIYKKISDIITGKADPSELLSEEDYQKYSIKKDTEFSKITNYKEIEIKTKCETWPHTYQDTYYQRHKRWQRLVRINGEKGTLVQC